MPVVVDSKTSRTVVVDSTRTAAIAERRASRLSVSDRRTGAAIERRTSSAQVSSPGLQGPPGPEGPQGPAGEGGGSGEFVPFLVPDAEVFTLPANRQAAYFEPIELEGDAALQLEGDLFDQVPTPEPAGADVEKKHVVPHTSFSQTILPEDSGTLFRCQGFQSGAKLIDFAGGPYELGQFWEVSNYLDSGGISVIASAGGIQFNVASGVSREPGWGEKRTYIVGYIDTINGITYIDVTP